MGGGASGGKSLRRNRREVKREMRRWRRRGTRWRRGGVKVNEEERRKGR